MVLYAVAGVTGHTGAAVATTLLQKQLPVKVIVRQSAQGVEWDSKGAQVAIANLNQLESLKKALEGVDVAYVLNPPNYTSSSMFDAAASLIETMFQAIEQSQLKKVVALSSMGAHQEKGLGNIHTAWLLEQRLSQLTIPVTFIRAAYFMENWEGVIPQVKQQHMLPSFLMPLDQPIEMVSTEDIGRVAAEEMLKPGREIIELEGPQLYNPNDVAATFSQLLKHPVQAMAVPEREWYSVLAHRSIHPATIPIWIEMLQAFNEKRVTFEKQGCKHVKGHITLTEAFKNIL